MLFHDGVGQSFDRPGGDDDATVHDGEHVGEFAAEIEILLDEQNAHFCLTAKPLERGADFIAESRSLGLLFAELLDALGETVEHRGVFLHAFAQQGR